MPYAAMRDGLVVGDTAALVGHDIERVGAHPDRPDRVFCGTFGAGLHRSTDGGRSFERVGADGIDPDESPAGAERRGAGPDGVSVMSVAVDPADPETVLVSAASGASAAHDHGGADSAESYVYRRTGDRWGRVAGLPTGEGVRRAVLAAGDAGEFHAANNRGPYQSTDAGRSWRAVREWADRFGDRTARGLAVV